MLHVRRIDSFDLPELQPYRTMRYQHEQRMQGIFVAEGEKVVRRLIESPLSIVSVMLPEKWLAEYERLLARRTEDIPVFVGPKELLESLTGFSMYQGLLAVGRVPAQPDLETLLRHSPRPWLLVATEGMSNALNMGSLVRNCAAFGAQAVLAGETCCSPFIRRAVRASMGAIFHLPALELGTPRVPEVGSDGHAPLAPGAAGPLAKEDRALTTALFRLRSQGVRIIAAHPHADRRAPAQADFRTDCCVVLGSEGQGLSVDVLAACDERVAIPMPPDVDSLNVASASAVFLYEVTRQRGAAAGTS
jgi:tRNA G18 (ribose-2'-O)-methylase SpoU